MKKNELNKNVILNEDAVKNIHCDEITAVINSNDSPKAMMNKLDDYHGSDIAEVISTFSVLNRRKFYRVCSLEMLAEIFEYLDEKQAGEYLREMDIHKASELISELDTDTAVNILSETDKDRRSLIIDAVAPDVRSELKLIASFDEEEIGSRMTTNCIIIDEDMTVKQAMNALVSQARKNDNISTLFVVDENKVFSGAIDLKDLITADSEVELESITATSFPYVYANEQTADCIEKLKDYSEYIIPVLDDSNRLLGVITAQNIIEASDDEMGEDYAKLGGLSAEEDLNEPVLQSVKKRLPWLLVLLGLGMVVSTEGDAIVAGHSILTEPDMVRKSITYLPDEAGAYKTMTGREYLEFMASIYADNGEQAYEFVKRGCEICELGDRLNDKISNYSRGMARKLLLARAIMPLPALAILDEPTSGLDIINALEIRRMIKKLASEGMSFLLSSHNMLEIEYVSDRVGIIAKGELLEVGKPAELIEKYGAQNLEEVFERVVLDREVL